MRYLSLVLSLGLVALAHSCCCARSHKAPEAVRDSTGRVPAGYYDRAEGLRDRDLKVALGSITADHEVFAYGALWYYYELTDVVVGTDNQVFDYYSPLTYYFTGLGTAPSVANKEHACPQSWWGSGAICNAYVDLFNVMPSEIGANSAKSNYPLGVVGSSPTYRNAHMRVGPSARREYDGPVFEPCDEFKGDFARIYFYVATTYADAAWGSKSSVSKTVAFSSEDYPTIKSWLLPLLLEWNAQDPVSDWEVTRNERVFSEQHNRNPFIDYPQLADYIWGKHCGEAFHFASSDINGQQPGQEGGGFFPDEGGNGGSDNPGGGQTSPDDDPVDVDGFSVVYLGDDFSAVTTGNDTETSASSTQWPGDDDFPEVSSAFEAGGAIKLGSSKKAGSLQSRPLGNPAKATLLVQLQVKGWTSVEGQLLVGIEGQPSQTVAYTHTIADGYEAVQLRFEHCPADCRLLISTSDKRAFLSSVYVGTPADQQAIQHVRPDDSAASPVTYCNLVGQPLPASSASPLLRLVRGQRPVLCL